MSESASNLTAPARASSLQVRNLRKHYGARRVVQDVSLTVKSGEVVGLLGPNGAGKTTTFRMLCGLLPATSGQLEVAGLNLPSKKCPFTSARAWACLICRKKRPSSGG